MDSNKSDASKNLKLTNEEINELTKKDKFQYYMSQVDSNLIEKWKK